MGEMTEPTDIASVEREGRLLYEEMAPYRVSVPCGRRGQWTLAPFDTVLDVHYMWQAADGRAPGIGVHTRLVHDEVGVFMSDTAPEILDLLPYLDDLSGDVLVSGLGIGMVLHILTQVESYTSSVRSITVLEVDRDVTALVAPHYKALDRRIDIIGADVFTWEPPPGSHWDSAWHDIWPDLAPHNLAEMEAVRERYSPFVTAGRQYFWGQRETLDKTDWDAHRR